MSSAARKKGLVRYIYVSSGRVGSRQKTSPAFSARFQGAPFKTRTERLTC